MNVKKKNVRKWVKALRSGEYEQATGALRTKDEGEVGLCCLGVACDLYLKEHPEDGDWKQLDEGSRQYQLFEEDAVLPDVVKNWLGMPVKNPLVETAGDGQWALTILNDTKHWGFPEIADAIERTYLHE